MPDGAHLVPFGKANISRAGKDVTIYVVDRNNLGKFSPYTNANYQCVTGVLRQWWSPFDARVL